MSETPPGRLPDPHDADRLDELLADRALFGLDDAEAAELQRLLAAAGLDDNPGYDLTAAAVAATVAAEESLPHRLRERLLDDAADVDFDVPETDTKPLAGGASKPTPRSAEWPRYTMLAVAAGILVSLWMGQSSPTPWSERRALISNVQGLTTIAWSPQDDPAITEQSGDAPYGDVVWSDELQQGYMRFRGLKANDPKVEQYQLWVFDAERDDRYPVDGGVFNIPSDKGEGAEADEQVVPIRVKLPVSKAVLFAITVEKPGGVVVSDRSRLPLLAKR